MHNIEFLPEELWYPAVSSYGLQMPYTEESDCVLTLENNPTPNQMQPLLLSSKGRLIYAAAGFRIRFHCGEIEVTAGDDADLKFVSGQKDLRGAYLYAVKNFFAAAPITVADYLFEYPIYNTWMYAPFEVTAEKVLDYARKIIASGLPEGTIIIDDKWCDTYGSWQFDRKKFPQPELLLQQLHALGFKVMLWLCPYVSFNTTAYADCLQKDLLLRRNSEIYSLQWWNESSACLDLRKREAIEYLRTKLERLQALGVDGFKFDGGDSMYYSAEHEPDKQSYLWAEFASSYNYNELRAEFNGAGLNLFERLADKRHSFGENGVQSLVPAALALGLGGHPFIAADMIGGGEIKDLQSGIKHDRALFLAHCQIAILFPNVQFSLLPAEILGTETNRSVLELLDQRRELWPYLAQLIARARVTKEPVLRLLEYVFPNAGLGKVTNYFMLGDKYLIAPTDKPNQKEIRLTLPPGKWRYDVTVYEGGQNIVLPADYRHLCILERLSYQS